MSYSTTIRTERFVFTDLREVWAKANEEQSGDCLAGVATDSERVAAKRVLADIPLSEIVAQLLMDPAHEEASRLIPDTHDQGAFRAIASLTVGEFREYLLDDAIGETELRQLQMSGVAVKEEWAGSEDTNRLLMPEAGLTTEE